MSPPQAHPKTTTVSGAPRKRVSEACTFCRGRKIKCNNERPVCSNCRNYGKTCVFEAVDETERLKSRPRPSRRAKEQQQTSSNDETSTRPDSSEQDETFSEQPESGQRSVSRLVFSSNGVSSYHGRTSALFEDHAGPEQRAAHQAPRMPTEWVQKGLVAEAAQQKQLESINYQHGRLDFDGVDPDLGMHLLDLHWNRQHHSYLITYRPVFMRDMACRGPYFSKILLNAIYFGASKFSPRLEVRRDADDVRTAGHTYRMRVKELLGSALDSSNITTIQALLIMAQSLFALGDERSAAWLYAGIAFRMLIDLGMHADTSALQSARRLSDEDMEIRRRVFWGAFGKSGVFTVVLITVLSPVLVPPTMHPALGTLLTNQVVDKMQSLYQGRPVSLQESDSRVPISFLDTYEEYEHWKPFAYDPHARDMYAGSPAYSVSTFTGLCQLSVIMNAILNNIYAEATFDKSADELSELQTNLDTRLRTWHDRLPQHLKIDLTKVPSVIPPPHILSLIAMYNVLLILLHRPFVSDGHLHSNARSIAVNSLLVCANAATAIVQILRLYHEAFSVRRAPYLISYATYVSATIHIRIAAKRSQGSDAHKSLATCLEVFRVNQETNWAARRAQNIVEGLAKKLKIDLPDTRDALAVTKGQLNRPVVPAAPTPVQPEYQQQQQQQPQVANDPGWQQGFSPNMDIDAIIQSFAREHEQQPMPQPGSNGLNLGNVQPFEANGPDGGVQNYPMDSGAWMGDANFSFDDLLFGFNGSTMDNFSMGFAYDRHDQ